VFTNILSEDDMAIGYEEAMKTVVALEEIGMNPTPMERIVERLDNCRRCPGWP